VPPATKDVSARLRADDRKLDPDLRRARRKFKKFGRETARDLKASFSKIRGALRTVAGLGGIIGFAQLGREVLDFETKLTRLRIAASDSGIDFNKFRDSITETSNATGQSRNDIVSAAAKFVELTGDAKTATQQMDLFARVATATGANIEDVTIAATDLSDKFKLKPGEFEAAFDVLIAQGNKGAIELKDLAAELTSIAPLFSQFGKSTGKGAVTELGAIFQAVRKGSASAKDAGTNMQNLLGGMSRQARKNKVSLFTTDETTGKKRKRTLTEMLEAFDKLAKSGRKGKSVDELFPDKQMRLAFLSWQANKKLVGELSDTQKMAGTTARQLAEFQASAAGRIATGWQRVKNQLTALFTPERIDKFATALEHLVKVLEFVLDNFTEIALVVGSAKFMSMGLAFVKAAAGADGLKAGLTGVLGKLNLVIAATAGLVALEKMIIKGLEAKQEKDIQRKVSVKSFRRNAAALGGPNAVGAARNVLDNLTLKNGKLSPEARAMARDQVAPGVFAPNVGRTTEIAAAIQQSNQILERFISERAAATLAHITVSVDKQGLLNADVGKAKRERRNRDRGP
jgi:TP901 family phage tail tape measure protein